MREKRTHVINNKRRNKIEFLTELNKEEVMTMTKRKPEYVFIGFLPGKGGKKSE